MKVLNEYPGKHHYWEEFKKINMFCPNCGKQSVYQCQDLGDYYVGEDYICSDCGADWTIQGPFLSKEINMINKVKQLRSGKTMAPTTKHGG